MFEACVCSSRKHETSAAKLLELAQPLELGGVHNSNTQWVELNVPVHRVVHHNRRQRHRDVDLLDHIPRWLFNCKPMSSLLDSNKRTEGNTANPILSCNSIEGSYRRPSCPQRENITT
jgi:hypothetical protein